MKRLLLFSAIFGISLVTMATTITVSGPQAQPLIQAIESAHSVQLKDYTGLACRADFIYDGKHNEVGYGCTSSNGDVTKPAQFELRKLSKIVSCDPDDALTMGSCPSN